MTGSGQDHRIVGVFKGGGAKGALYAGACEAVVARGLSFAQVAGSSAGAITAALIAAGATPRHLRELEQGGRRILAMPSGMIAARNLHNTGGILSFDDLTDWLATSLTRLYEEELGGEGAGPSGPTFSELAAAGGIPLHIACADLNWRTPVVFNAELTPDLPVAKAAAASSAIPVAFEMPRLCRPEEAGAMPVSDGGVMANLPLFVFTDEDYRAMAGLGEPVADTVVGFTLVDDESPRHTSPSGEIGDEYRRRFAEVEDVTTYSEMVRSTLHRAGQPSLARRFEHRRGAQSAAAAVLAAPLYVLDAVLRVVELVVLVPVTKLLSWARHPSQRPGEIDATGQRARRWTRFANAVFDLAPGYVVIGLALLIPVLIFGLPTVVMALWPDWGSFFEENNVFQGSWMVAITALLWLFLAIGLLLVLVLIVLGTATYVLGWIVKPVVGEVAPRLVATFMSNPQEPAWTGAGAHRLLIRIVIPAGWTTLRSTDDSDRMDAELDRVRSSVDRQLASAGLGHPPV